MLVLPFVESTDTTFCKDLSCCDEWAEVTALDLTLQLDSNFNHINRLNLNDSLISQV